MKPVDGIYTLVYTVDYFPTVSDTNDERKTIRIDKIETNVSDTEIQSTLNALASSYSTFEPIENIQFPDTLVRVKATYLDAEGNTLGDKSRYIGKEEIQDNDTLANSLEGKVVNDTVSVSYQTLAHIE